MRQPSAPVAQLPFNEIKELQQLLVRAGFNVGKVDGVLGQQSRTRGEGDADQIRPAGGFLADRRIAGADARGAARRLGGCTGVRCNRATPARRCCICHCGQGVGNPLC